MMELMFNMFDTNSDGMISAVELDELMEMGDDDHDDHDDHGDKLVGHATLEVLAEGDYGFAMPADVELHIVITAGGHDDHDDHSGHDDHDDHDDHGAEDGHDNHWTLERGMEDCDSDNDELVSYTELLACVQTDLANDGHDDVQAATVLED